MSRNDNVSIYRGISPDVQASVSWPVVIKSITEGKYKKNVEALRQIQNPETYRTEKTKLISATFGGTFNGRRNNAAVVQPTGFIVADIDHIDNLTEVSEAVKEDEHVWFSFISPGGNGIKVGFRSHTVENDAQHKQFYAAVSKYIEDVYKIKIDAACKDISRLTFVSWDTNAHINPDAAYFDHSSFDDLLDQSEKKTPLPPAGSPTPSKLRYGVSVLETACKKIAQSVPGEKHKTRLDQSTLVGGFIAGGYIDYNTALDLLIQAVIDSGTKNLVNSTKTIKDGLANGMTRPLDPIAEIPPPTPPSPRESPPIGDVPPDIVEYPQFSQLANEIINATKKEEPQREPLGVITFSEISAREFKVSPIVEGVINEGDQTIIYSPGGVGKSLIAQDIAMHVACRPGGMLWGKFKIPKTRATAFIQSENSGLAIKERVRLKCEGIPELWCGTDNLLVPHRGDNYQITGHVSNLNFRKEITEWLKRAQESVGDTPLGLIVWDPLISYHDGDENDNSTMRTTLDYITEISGEIGATSIVIHHSRKDTDKNGEGMRGASAIFDWTRNGIKLEKDEYRDQKQIIVKNVKSNNSKPFKTFRLALDDNLNFMEVDFTEMLQPQRRQTGIKVVETLTILGGEAVKRKLIDQYKELSSIKSDHTVHKHIDNAVIDGFLTREYIRVGDSKVQVANYRLASQARDLREPWND